MKSNINRRLFIKQSGLASGAVLVNSSMPGIIRQSNGTNELKIGLIGCGGRGTGAASQALMAHSGNVLYAMGDVFEDHITRRYEALMDVDEIKDQVRVDTTHKFVGFDAYRKVVDSCDVVILATPPAFRPEHFEYAVAQNKHVFMEKPLSCDGFGVRRILKAGKQAADKDLKVVVGLQNRYDPAHIQFVEQIQKGAIGDIISSTCYYMKGGYKVVPRSTTTSELAFQIKNYHYFTWLWAGAPGGLQIHNADIVHWAKNSYPVSAQGVGGRAILEGSDTGDVFDHFYIEYTYPDGMKMHSEIRNNDNTFRKNGVWMTGTKAIGNPYEGIRTHSGELIWKFQQSDHSIPSQIEHDRLFEAILNNRPLNNTDYGAYSTLAAIMGRMASHTGQVMSWEEALNSGPFVKQDITGWNQAPVLPDEQGIYPYPRPGTKVKS